jgi:transposase
MILYRSETQEVYFLKPKGFPVGIELPEEGMFAKSLALQKISLHKGDILVIYTDGITEAMNTRKDQYGEARLIQVIKENAHLTPAEFVNALNESIAQFTQGAEQNDDITVVAIKEKLKAENVVFKFRKKLIDLVEKRGLSVAEACRQMNISTNTYYHYKKIFDEKGHQGLKPSKAKGKKAIQELSLQQKQAVITLVREHPDYGAQLIAKSLKSRSDQPLSIDPQLINQYLKRKSLNSAEERKAFSLNEVDTL